MPHLTPESRDTSNPFTPGGAVVVEAPSTEVALREVAVRLGEGAEILGAEKVRRGGIGGFFARELVQLTVRVPGSARTQTTSSAAPAPQAPADPPSGAGEASRGAAAAPTAVGPLAGEEMPTRPARQREAEDVRGAGDGGSSGGMGKGMAGVLARLAGETDAAELTFQDSLRRELLGAGSKTRAAAPPVALAGPVAPSPERSRAEPARGEAPRAGQAPRVGWVRDPASSPGTGPVRWSAGALHRLGLPGAVVNAAEAQEPVDDAGWTLAIAAAVAPYCRPLPSGAHLLVGPKAHRIGEGLGLPLYRREDAPPAHGDAAVRLRDSVSARTWLSEVRGDRWLHLVVGGSGWHGLLFDEPLAVSWVGADALPSAITLCATFGTVLGYGADTGLAATSLVRGNPLDVAAGVRSLLPRI